MNALRRIRDAIRYERQARRIRNALTDWARSHGIEPLKIDVTEFTGLPEPVRRLVLLATQADAGAETLRANTRGVWPEVLVKLGLSKAEIENTHLDIASQETVDRDFEGSWFYYSR